MFKLTEINADTPCGMPEAYYANVVAQQVFAANTDIEDYHEDLAKPFVEILERQFSAADKVNIVCAANKDYLEDLCAQGCQQCSDEFAAGMFCVSG